MRGKNKKQQEMLALINPEALVPANHPLREIKKLADAALKEMSPLFDEMYAREGRASIPPERLLKASLLMALYTVRSEGQFCEQLNYNLLFKWFLDMNMTEAAFEHSGFSQNRKRLLEHQATERFFIEVVALARKRQLLSAEHFTVDGTLIEAWASLKSFKRREGRDDDTPDDPGNPSVDFKGEKRCNDTHQSTTDPEARLYKKGEGKESKLCYGGQALMENRHGLLLDFRITPANGTAEREQALVMLEDRVPGSKRITVGADKGRATIRETSWTVAGC
jgi:transposase